MKNQKRTPLGLIVGVVLLVCVMGAVVIGYASIASLMSPLNPNNSQLQQFVISPGQGFSIIAQKLTDEKLIRSAWSLKLAAYFESGKGRNIQAGKFNLAPNMSPSQILAELAHGKTDTKITIIEGWRREEIAENISQIFIENNVPFDKNKFLQITVGKEGYLFPDTYLLPINTNESTIASILETTLTKKVTAQMMKDINASGHSFHEILTMASIIEREARTDGTRKMVAGILWKRLSNGWPLQADATLQFVKGYNQIEKTWWANPLAVDKELKSPYNTYLQVGLPPGPICAPSLSSIEASVYPTNSSYWYYITDNQGNMRYAETLNQHNQNISTYLR